MSHLRLSHRRRDGIDSERLWTAVGGAVAAAGLAAVTLAVSAAVPPVLTLLVTVALGTVLVFAVPLLAVVAVGRLLWL